MTLRAPPPTLLFEDSEGRYVAELSRDEHRHGYWPAPEKVPERILLSTIAAEDCRFYTHLGVDPKSILRAVAQNLRRMRRVSGASTLAMQVARLQNPGKRSLLRKVSEAVTALVLTRRYGREAVIRHYLRIAPYGNQNYGAAYAARRYLDKPLQDLTWSEAALLAALPKLPGRMNIYKPEGREAAERRAGYVLSRLKQLGWIPEEEYGRALDQLPRIRLAAKDERPPSCLHAILALQKQLSADPRRWPQDRGYIVRTTLNLDVQDAVGAVASNAVREFRADGAGNLAVLVAEKETGNIVAYLGSDDYYDKDNKGSIDYARVPRSSGSTLKPFIYGLGMSQKGYTAATLLTDVGLALDSHAGTYVLRNYDEAYLGPILYRNALANSRNVPAVEVLEAVGVETAYRHLTDLGLVHKWRDPHRYGLTLAVGGLYVTLWDLVRAYGILANDGRAFDLRWTPAPPSARRTHAQVIPEDVARQLTLFLSDPMARLPSFPRMGWLEYPFPVAVKTGTSQGYRDAWCVGYSPKYIVGVWVGHPENYPMKRRCGADSAAMVVHQVMERLHPEEMEGLQDLSFPPPRGYTARRIDLLSGKLARQDTPYVALEWFKAGTEPVEETDVYREVTVDTRSGLPAAPGCPGEFQRRKTYVALEPRFASWARQSGLELPPLPDYASIESLLSRKDPKLSVREPKDGAQILGDPETPADCATISLQASVEPPVPQVIWYVDGKPYEVVDYPYTTRWRLEPGSHAFHVALPFAPIKSASVKVTIQQ